MTDIYVELHHLSIKKLTKYIQPVCRISLYTSNSTPTVNSWWTTTICKYGSLKGFILHNSMICLLVLKPSIKLENT